MSGALATLAGAGSKMVSIGDAIIGDVFVGGADARYRLASNGDIDHFTGISGYTTQGAWLISGLNSSYEVRATINSGALTSGTTGSWLALSTSREWIVQDAVPNGTPVLAELLIEIRHTSGTVLDSAIIDLSADRTA